MTKFFDKTGDREYAATKNKKDKKNTIASSGCGFFTNMNCETKEQWEYEDRLSLFIMKMSIILIPAVIIAALLHRAIRG